MTTFNIQDTKYIPFKVSKTERKRAIYWAKQFFDRNRASGGSYSWGYCMKLGWRFMYWELLWNLRKNFLVDITFTRKVQNVRPDKPLYTKRLVTNNGGMLANSTGRKNESFRASNSVMLEQWYFTIGEFKENGVYNHPIAMRFDAVKKVHGWYQAAEIISKTNIPVYV